MSIYKHNEKSVLGRNNVLNTVDNWKNGGGTVYQNHTMTKAEAERIVKTLDKCSFSWILKVCYLYMQICMFCSKSLYNLLAPPENLENIDPWEISVSKIWFLPTFVWDVNKIQRVSYRGEAQRSLFLLRHNSPWGALLENSRASCLFSPTPIHTICLPLVSPPQCTQILMSFRE